MGTVNADFYKFAKRKNSTKQPTGTGTTFSIDLKSGTSYISPTFLLNNSGKPDYNYLVFEGWYYFITDITSVRQDLWEVSCNIDALATAKSAILNTKAYVLYDSVSNTEIPDNRLPIKTTKSVSANSVACPLSVDGGCYILSITGAHGSTGVYKVTEGQLASLIDDVSNIENNIFDFGGITPPSAPSAPSGGTLEDYVEFVGDMLEFVGNYIKYAIDCAVRPISQFFGSGNIPENIRECRYIPFNRGVTGTPITVYLGTFLTQTTIAKLVTDTIVDSVSVNIPWQANDFRRRSPYTDVYLYIPYIGMTKLSSENLIGQSSVTVSYALCVRDGSMIVTVTSGSEILGQYSANVSASVPVGISNINVARSAQAVITGAAAAMNGSPSAIGMAAVNFHDSVTPNFSCVGGLDGIAGTATNQNVTCYTVFHDTVEAPNTELMTVGSPTNAPKALSTLTGFCQCMEAHVEADLPGTVLDMVDSYLNSGFFIE